uniref:AAA domain-containing protein n=1 Tax=Echinostoma caproni TaxID=27848 RepID=A0A183ASQ1_9TREM
LSEVIRLRYLLGLPALVLPSFRWFMFAIRHTKDLASLVVLDCADPERNFIRLGSVSTWFPGMRGQNKQALSVNAAGDSNHRVELTPPAEAIRDLWSFISETDKATDTDNSVPCLICRAQSSPDGENELVLFSRLLRNTRHHNVARANMPRDCRFVLLPASPIKDQSENNASVESEQSDSTQVLRQLQAIREEIFIDSETEVAEKSYLKFRHYSCARDFLKAGVTRSLPWMEASLELDFLRELKTNSALVERLQQAVRLSGTPSNVLSSRGLQHVPNTVLRRLASVGLGRTRLSRLAGLTGWHGFAGLLAFRFCPPSTAKSQLHDTYCENGGNGTKPFVTDDLQVIQDLYTYFRRIHGHMDRHNQHYREDKSKPKSSVRRILPTHAASFPVVDNPTRVHAWVAGGNTLFYPEAPRQPRILSAEESMELMQKAQKAYQEARMNREFPSYPTIPPDSEKLYRYRNIHRDSESESQSSEDEESSDPEAGDDDIESEESLHMEDVD